MLIVRQPSCGVRRLINGYLLSKLIVLRIRILRRLINVIYHHLRDRRPYYILQNSAIRRNDMSRRISVPQCRLYRRNSRV